jgi:hypothetical protein
MPTSEISGAAEARNLALSAHLAEIEIVPIASSTRNRVDPCAVSKMSVHWGFTPSEIAHSVELIAASPDKRREVHAIYPPSPAAIEIPQTADSLSTLTVA